MKLLEWYIREDNYLANICKIGNEIVKFEIVPYGGAFELFIANSFHSTSKRLATAQNKAQKFYNQFLESC
jgi:hypothetical protein